jgi:hypothetical protein
MRLGLVVWLRYKAAKFPMEKSSLTDQKSANVKGINHYKFVLPK